MALSRPPGFFITEKIQTTYHKLLPLVSLPTQESWCSASFILFLLIQRKKHFHLLSNCPLNYLPSAPFTLTVSLSDLFLFGFKYSQVSEILKKTSVAHCNTTSLLNFHSVRHLRCTSSSLFTHCPLQTRLLGLAGVSETGAMSEERQK